MALYFFHLRDGVDVALDPDGIELPSLDAARKKALEAARDSLSHDIKAGRMDVGLRIDVENGDGRVLHSQPFREAFEISGAD
ncbi:MAG TPA: hypothetical protein VNT25_01210 [Allosphingosinicella sp.]|jgi:hypothetical protein|nr:hypothetical protein [Allosphingosinicella sp.]